MLEKLIELFVNNKFLVCLFAIIVVAAGVFALYKTPIDAIPDLSDVQVIIYSEWMGQSPQEIEDQVTYPLSTAMLAVPKVKAVRGYSYFGFSFVYIIFEDGTDLYWARSRVMEYMNYVVGRLPQGVTTSLGPDATGVGWVFQYTVEGEGYSLGELRAIQDWYVRYQLTSVPGVAEVATVGGFVMQYQINLEPEKLLAYNIPINKVMMAIRNSNKQIGASMMEFAGTEYMVRGLGYFDNIEDIKNVVVGKNQNGTPIFVKDIAYVAKAPAMRRGIAEKDGEGEVVSGIVVMRYGKNVLEVIENVKKKIKEIEPGLPPGVKIVPVYDRSHLIHRSINTLQRTLIEEIITVAAVCVVFLWHVRSALVAIITLPLGILMSLIIMKVQGLNANIMSLGGIAIAIGVMVDASVVMIENVHKLIEHDEQTGEHRSRWAIMIEASQQVGPGLFFSLLVVTVSFLPVFSLQAQEGRLFSPLAFTKTYAMASSAFLAIILVPVLMGFFIRGRITPEHKNPLNRFLIWAYRPFIHLVLKFQWITIGLAIVAVAVTLYPLKKLGSEFMPALNEGDIFYMPMTLPGVSITSAKDILQLQDKILRTLPEAETVLGKIGRANTATDPAGLDMAETIVILKPMNKWRKGMTIEKLMEELDSKIKIPGVTNAWTMPIKTRIDMLATGIRTPVGVKVFGADLKTIDEVSHQIEEVIKQVEGTTSAYSVRLLDANYVDIDIHREEAARYGLTVKDVQDVIESAIGGMPITTTVEGRRRFPVAIRYANEYRDDLETLKRVMVPVPMGGGMEGGMEEMGGGMSMGKKQDGKMAMGKMGGGGMSSRGSGMSSMGAMGGMSSVPSIPMPSMGSGMSTGATGGGMSMGGGMSSMSSMGGISMPVSTGFTPSMSGMSMTSMGTSMNSMTSMTSMFASLNSLPSVNRQPMGAPMLAQTPPLSTSLWRGVGGEVTRLTQVPLEQLADITTKKGPMAIMSENGMLTGTIYIDMHGRDIGSYVRDAKKAVAEKVKFPEGYYVTWSGQYEYMMRAQARLKLIVPITLAVIFLLLYFNFKNITEALIVMLSLPFAVIGGIWVMYFLNFNMSIAVGVGFIALAGLAAETGVVMLVFLDLAYKRRKAYGAMTKEKLYDAIMEGAVLRVRPKMMTITTTIVGLLPLFWGHGTGSEVMRRIAAPMIGGLVSSVILTLLVIPAIYAIWKGFEIRREERRQAC